MHFSYMDIYNSLQDSFYNPANIICVTNDIATKTLILLAIMIVLRKNNTG